MEESVQGGKQYEDDETKGLIDTIIRCRVLEKVIQDIDPAHVGAAFKKAANEQGWFDMRILPQLASLSQAELKRKTCNFDYVAAYNELKLEKEALVLEKAQLENDLRTANDNCHIAQAKRFRLNADDTVTIDNVPVTKHDGTQEEVKLYTKKKIKADVAAKNAELRRVRTDAGNKHRENAETLGLYLDLIQKMLGELKGKNVTIEGTLDLEKTLTQNMIDTFSIKLPAAEIEKTMNLITATWENSSSTARRPSTKDRFAIEKYSEN